MRLVFLTLLTIFSPYIPFKYRILRKFLCVTIVKKDKVGESQWVPLDCQVAVSESLWISGETVSHSCGSERTGIAGLSPRVMGLLVVLSWNVDPAFHFVENWLKVLVILPFIFLCEVPTMRNEEFDCGENLCLLHCWKYLESTRATKEWK